jgi:secreted Zn-dependent insulinase-like peptidase
MFIIGHVSRGGLRVTSLQTVETAEQLYYWILLWRRNHLDRLNSGNYHWQQNRLQEIAAQTLEQFLQDRGNRWTLPDIYELDGNTVPADQNSRTTEKINNARLIELFRQNNFNLMVVGNYFDVPVGLLHEEPPEEA